MNNGNKRVQRVMSTRDRREGSFVNTPSTKIMQLVVTTSPAATTKQPDDGSYNDTSQLNNTESSSTLLCDVNRAENAQLATLPKELRLSVDLTPDPIVQTIEEVIARSVAIVDTGCEVVPASASEASKKRKKPQGNLGMKKLANGVRRADQEEIQAAFSPTSTSNKSGGSTLPCLPVTLMPSLHADSASDVSSPSTVPASDPANVINGAATRSVSVTSGKTATRKRTEVPAVLPAPVSSISTTSTSVMTVSTVRRSKREPVLPEKMRPTSANGKLADLLQKRKVSDAVVVEVPAAVVEVKKPDPAPAKKRKLDSMMNKKGEKSVWSWRGRSFTKPIYSETDKRNILRICYNSIKHVEGEVVQIGDCVLLRAAKGQKPHVGKVAAFWDGEQGQMMMTIFWYWRPEEVENEMRPEHGEMEVYVSNLRDENHVNSIDEKCFVLTARQYARFMAELKENDTFYRRPRKPVVPPVKSLIDKVFPDIDTDPEVIYFADRGFDGKHKRFWGYYFRGNKLRKYTLE